MRGIPAELPRLPGTAESVEARLVQKQNFPIRTQLEHAVIDPVHGFTGRKHEALASWCPIGTGLPRADVDKIPVFLDDDLVAIRPSHRMLVNQDIHRIA